MLMRSHFVLPQLGGDPKIVAPLPRARAVCGEAAVVLITSTDAAASSLLRDADGAVGAALADAVTLVSLSSRSKDMATAMGACFARPCDHSWL